MSLDNRPIYSGGCQCGAVRFRIEGALGTASVCHCRMCQKASGGFYQPLVQLAEAKLTWTRGGPKTFRSSNYAVRGFCGDCGTPLTFESGGSVDLSIVAFDRPVDVPPIVQLAGEARIPWGDHLAALQLHPAGSAGIAERFATVVSRQHPDHDTAEWTPGE